MPTLRERCEASSDFLVGIELVSIRGTMAEQRAIRARSFANQLVDFPQVDWVSFTDNAGGNPQLSAQSLAKPILYAGKEVVIHLTCKDLNRNGLESAAWQLSSEGFHNVLALTGDYPVGGSGGVAKPVFDLDSVGLIALLEKMNRGFDERHQHTQFFVGAVVNNYKLKEGEVVPQYLKMMQKSACGAKFFINQVGYDARKAHELRLYMDRHDMAGTPLFGNVFVLSPKTAAMFHEGRIPGVCVTSELLEICQRQGRSADGGREFFLELAAKQMAVFRELGYRGAYLGGVIDIASVEKILVLEKTYTQEDRLSFARELRFSRTGEYFFYGEDRTTGLSDPEQASLSASEGGANIHYAMAKWVHGAAFTPGGALARIGERLSRSAKNPLQGPATVRMVERATKTLLFDCRDCGDCSLPETAFLCPESQCAKNQRNGPCGGTRGGKCEVDGFGDCIWLRAYDRLKGDGREADLLSHVPVLQDQSLRGTSSWANNWLGKDHASGSHGSHTDLRSSPHVSGGDLVQKVRPPAETPGGD